MVENCTTLIGNITISTQICYIRWQIILYAFKRNVKWLDSLRWHISALAYLACEINDMKNTRFFYEIHWIFHDMCHISAVGLRLHVSAVPKNGNDMTFILCCSHNMISIPTISPVVFQLPFNRLRLSFIHGIYVYHRRSELSYSSWFGHISSESRSGGGWVAGGSTQDRQPRKSTTHITQQISHIRRLRE